jgi:hypothetical protein
MLMFGYIAVSVQQLIAFFRRSRTVKRQWHQLAPSQTAADAMAMDANQVVQMKTPSRYSTKPRAFTA